MKKIFLTVLSVIALSASPMLAQTSSTSEGDAIRAAVMKVYDDALSENPNDFATRYSRAMQHYFNGDYAKSLTDVTQAIETTPADEKELLFDELILRARIYDQQKNYTLERLDLERATAISSTNLAGVDMVAKLALQQGDLTTAEKNFNAILRQSPQNYDAMYGLARVEAARGDQTKALEYADRAVKLFPAEAQVYINRSNIYSSLGQYQMAAQDLILAMSLGNGNLGAAPALYAMSGEHYNEVMQALQQSIDYVPGQANLHYLRANIAMENMHYGSALHDLNIIVGNRYYEDASIYRDKAYCEFQLGQLSNALNSINKSIEFKADDPDSYVLRARIQRFADESKTYASALATLQQAERLSSTNTSCLIEQAKIMIAKRQNDAAVQMLDRVLKIEPQNVEALLMRGWVAKYRQGNPESALADFGRVLSLGSDLESMRGFALHELGRDDEARQWAQNIITASNIVGGNAYVVASALYSDIDDNDQAIKFLESALANGYGSWFEVKTNEDPYVNLKLVRRHADFQTLIERYVGNFDEK